MDSAQQSPTTVVKTEQNTERPQQTQLYRMTPSPGPQSSFGTSHQHNYSHRESHDNCSPTHDMQYSSSSSSPPTLNYSHMRQPNGVLNLPSNDLYYHQPYIRPENGTVDPSCSCLTNPAAGHPFISLTHQLQNTLEILRQLPEHSSRHQCLVLKRIAQLYDVMQ